MISCFVSIFRFAKIETSNLEDSYMQKINLCKRSQVITRYALIDLPLILSYLKLYEAHYLSNFDLSSATKLFLYLAELYLFSEMRGLPSKNSKNEFGWLLRFYFLLRTKFKFNSFLSLISYRYSYLSGNPASVRGLSSGIPCHKSFDYFKTTISLLPYFLTFTKTYLQSFWQTFLMLCKTSTPWTSSIGL